MKRGLRLLFGSVMVLMLAVTVRASLAQSLWDALPGYAANPWAVATLYDAYFGFLTFYVWVFYKERSWGLRALWLVLIAGLGNIAMPAYVLMQLARWREEEGAAGLLLRRSG